MSFRVAVLHDGEVGTKACLFSSSDSYARTYARRDSGLRTEILEKIALKYT